MRPIHFYLAFVGALSTCFGPSASAGTHRLLVLDIGRYQNHVPGSDHHRLLLLEIESGNTVASAELGGNTSLGVSPKGDVIATVSSLGETRLDFYRAKDLCLLKSGRFPDSIPRRVVHQLGAAADIALSPSGQEILVCSMEGGGNVDLATAVVSCVGQKLDREGFFTLCHKPMKIARCRGVSFVDTAAWPRVHVLNQTFSLLETLDLGAGKILSSLPLGDGPGITFADRASLENADFKLILRVRLKGVLIPGGSGYAYYIPRSISRLPALPPPPPTPGFLKKIDLTVDPPKVIRKGAEPEPDLRAGIAAVSEAAGALFVLEERRHFQFTHEPSRWLRVFSTSELKFQRQIELPLTDCHCLQASRDGRYLYALDSEDAKLAILETASGRVVKVLPIPGKYPLLMTALPEQQTGE